MDFDDLLGNAVELLQRYPDLLEHYQRRFKHVLVDEYQDTNTVQNELVLLLTDEPPQRLRRRRRRPVPPRRARWSRRPTGPKPIEQIEVGDEVLGTGGGFELVAGRGHAREGRRLVAGRHVPRSPPAVGRSQGTPHHIVFADPMLDPASGSST